MLKWFARSLTKSSGAILPHSKRCTRSVCPIRFGTSPAGTPPSSASCAYPRLKSNGTITRPRSNMMAFIIRRFLRLTVITLLPTGTLCGGPLLDEGYRQMYNLQFGDAHKTFAEYERKAPADPLGPV